MAKKRRKFHGRNIVSAIAKLAQDIDNSIDALVDLIDDAELDDADVSEMQSISSSVALMCERLREKKVVIRRTDDDGDYEYFNGKSPLLNLAVWGSMSKAKKFKNDRAAELAMHELGMDGDIVPYLT